MIRPDQVQFLQATGPTLSNGHAFLLDLTDEHHQAHLHGPDALFRVRLTAPLPPRHSRLDLDEPLLFRVVRVGIPVDLDPLADLEITEFSPPCHSAGHIGLIIHIDGVNDAAVTTQDMKIQRSFADGIDLAGVVTGVSGLRGRFLDVRDMFGRSHRSLFQ